MDVTYYGNELYHHGILGQKWGVRRYQNADGSYKAGAKGRYNDTVPIRSKNESKSSGESKSTTQKKGLSDKQKTAIKVGAGLAAAALIAYGGYKLSKSEIGQRLISSGRDRVNGLMHKNKSTLVSQLKADIGQQRKTLGYTRDTSKPVSGYKVTKDSIKYKPSSEFNKVSSLESKSKRSAIADQLKSELNAQRSSGSYTRNVNSGSMVNRTQVQMTPVNRTQVQMTPVNRTPVQRTPVQRTPVTSNERLKQAQEALAEHQRRVAGISAEPRRKRER